MCLRVYLCVCLKKHTWSTKVVAVIASTTELAQMITEIFKRILSTFKNKTKKNENRARGEAKAKKKLIILALKKQNKTKNLKEGRDSLRTGIVDLRKTAYSSASDRCAIFLFCAYRPSIKDDDKLQA